MKRNMFNWTMLQGVGASCWFMWIGSSFFSYWGFTRLAPNAPWWVKAIAGGFAVAINFIEYMGDNFSWVEFWHPKYMRDYILRAFWAVCYVYDIYTNMLGWIGVVGMTDAHSMIAAWKENETMTTFAGLFGIGFAIGPEPVYIWFLEQNFPYPGQNLLIRFANWIRRVKGQKTYQPTGYHQYNQSGTKPTQPTQAVNSEFLKRLQEKNRNQYKGS